VIAAAYEHRDRVLEDLLQQLGALSSLQRAILKRMVELGDGTQPFSQDAIADYRKVTGVTRVSSQTVQKAMDGLIANGFIWRSSREDYALDDTMVAEFFYDDLIQGALLRELAAPKA
jgi:DNA-binding MarR family transcriptional regulator